MAVDESNVRIAITGAVSKAPLGTTAPTSVDSPIDSHTDLGGISEDGVILALPDNGEATPIKIWQNGATVRTVRSTSDDLPTFQFTMVETKRETVETYFGVTVDPQDGSFEYIVQNRDADDYVVDVVDDANLERYHIPRGVVASVAEVTLANTSAIGYQVTLECERDATTGYNLKGWKTALIGDESSSSSSSSSSS